MVRQEWLIVLVMLTLILLSPLLYDGALALALVP
jgi:hypothetical protein